MNYKTKNRTDKSNWIENLMSFNSVKELKINLFKGYSGFTSLPKKIIIIGASPLISELIDGLLEKNTIIEGVFDQDINKIGKFFKGRRVCSLEEIGNMEPDIPVLIGTHRTRNLYKYLKPLNFQYVWPFPLFSFYDNDQFKPHPFYKGIIEDLFENRDQIKWLYKNLSDEKSKHVLNAIVGFRLTYNPEILDELIDPFPYFPKDIIRLCNKEVLVDGGAFNGDSIRLFKEITSDKFKCIIPFEPSPSVFKLLKETFYQDKRIIPTNACLFNKKTTLLFDSTKGRASAVSSSNGNICQALNIDCLNNADDITFIKLNIEGAESDALSGAERTLKEKQPKIAVAVYHRPDHLWYLAKQIRKINPNYTLHLRQHDGGIIETVLYAI